MAYPQVYRAKVKLYQRLKIKGDQFRVNILCRDTGSRLAFWISFSSYLFFASWALLSHRFQDVPRWNLASILSMSFIPVLLLGIFGAFPDRQIWADQFLNRMEIRLRWMGRIFWRWRIHIKDCVRMEMVSVVKEPVQRRKRDYVYSIYYLFSAPLNYFLYIFRFMSKESENQNHYGILFTFTSGKTLLTHVTRNEAECKKAVLALKTLFPNCVIL